MPDIEVKSKPQSDEAVRIWANEWGVDQGAAYIALDLEMHLRIHGGGLEDINEIRDLARRINLYGQDKLKAGVDAERERYSEQGE